LGVLLWLGLWVGGRSIIGFLLGTAYQQTGELLTILSPILIFKSLSFACASLLVAVGWQRYRVVAQVVSAAANILLNVLVIKQFGVQGVAVVYVVSEFILVIGYGGLALRWLRNIQINRVVKWK
jgi:O-antigen/teichoic acid export membrane protein